MEIIDAQIHEPRPPKPLGDALKAAELVVNVELAREAMDCVGVDIALAFTRPEFCDAAMARYPERFVGAPSCDNTAPDIDDQVRKMRTQPGVLATRSLISFANTAEIRPDYMAGKYEGLYVAAEKHGLPVFFSSHGHTAELLPVIRAHPNLTIVIDHIGQREEPPSPKSDQKWQNLNGLLECAQFPNVAVKLCGAPLLSREPHPYRDNWPNLHKVFSAFGVERIMWASDFTRMRSVPGGGGGQLAPRDEWVTYSDSLTWLRDTSEISQKDKEWLFGGALRRVLRWPKAS